MKDIFRIDLQLFAEMNTQTTLLAAEGNNLSAEMKTFYDMTLIDEASANLVHDQFGQKRPIPSGGGKTTFCHLLPRFYELDSGSIEIDGVDIKNFTRKSLREHIGIVAQDVFLFAGTVKENIAYGKLNATDEEIIEAAKKANIHEFISTLEKGYDTYVGERGIKLSGGQKQRISIARAFLKNPEVLILDEATSALDNVTELQIQEALDKLCDGRTTIVVAHRLSTVRNADMICVITNEGVVEKGTHEELLSLDGVYKELYTGFTKIDN